MKRTCFRSSCKRKQKLLSKYITKENKSFTMAQLKKLLDIHENTIIKIFTNRIENLESKITSTQEENKQLKGKVKALQEQESIEFQNETYEK